MELNSDTPTLGTVALHGNGLAVARCGDLLIDMGFKVQRVLWHPQLPSQARKKSRFLEYYGHRHRPVRWNLSSEAQDGGLSHDESRLSNVDIFIYDSLLPAETLDALREEVPVVCSLTPFGMSMSTCEDEYSEVFTEAVTGLMATNGYPSAPPRVAGFPIAAHLGAIAAATASLAALLQYRTSGKRVIVDAAWFDACMIVPGTFLGKRDLDPKVGNRHPSAAPWSSYSARDGEVVICCGDNGQWLRLLGAMDLPELATDSRFQNVESRVHNVASLDEVVQGWVSKHSVEEVVHLLWEARVPVADVLTPSAVLEKLIAEGYAEWSLDETGSLHLVPSPLVRIEG